MSSAKSGFISALMAISNEIPASLDALNVEFRDALLAYGSHTDDNLASVERLNIQKIERGFDAGAMGIVLSSIGVPIADILNVAEGSDIPTDVRQKYPELVQADWDAVLRIATLVFSALQGKPAAGPFY